EMLIDELGYELTGVVDNGESALLIIGKSAPDLILMDIDLKGKLTGLDVARIIKNKNIPIIFTTSFKDRETYAEAMETNAYGYLVKPFSKLSLQSSIEMTVRSVYEKGIGNKKSEKNNSWETDLLLREFFMIKQSGVLQKVKINDINFIQGEGNYSTLHTDKKKFVVKMSMKKILAKLDSNLFIHVHKSYLIQLNKVDSIDTLNHKINIGENSIPLGRNFKTDLLDRFELLK
ncbi:MAG: response regulator transcription factor, partial [Bacteroidota bacterium]